MYARGRNEAISSSSFTSYPRLASFPSHTLSGRALPRLLTCFGGGFQGQKVAEYRFKAVGEAYGILKDEAKKRRYDRGVPKHKCDDADSDYGYGGGGFGGGWGEEDHYRQRARRGPYGRR